MDKVICYDYGPHEIGSRHGQWWLTTWFPIGNTWYYVGAASSPRWNTSKTEGIVNTKRLLIKKTRPRDKPYFKIQQWCAHINVSYDD